jgi:hypothetical protein
MVSLEECIAIIGPQRQTVLVLWSPLYRSIRARLEPNIRSPYLGEWSCLERSRTVLGQSGEFFLIDDDDFGLWFRKCYLRYGAKIAPSDPSRRHIKVRLNPSQDRSNWLKHNGKIVEVARDQVVSLLEWRADTQMVNVGLHHNSVILTGWVKRENLGRI